MRDIIKVLIVALTVFISQTIYPLEIYRMDPLNFGEVVRGDRRITLEGVRVYVKGRENESVRLDIPQEIGTDAGRIRITPRERIIRLNDRGRGYFLLRCELKPSYGRYGRVDDTLDIRVSYK